MSLASVNTPWSFFIGRGLVGMALGVGGTASSALLAEIAPPDWRGRFLEMNELSVVRDQDQAEMLGCLDLDGDGKIQLSEWLAWHRFVHENLPSRLNPDG